MALVEFENDKTEEFHIRSPKISLFGDPETPTMIKLLIKSKLVKTEKQAFYVLVGFVLFTIIVIIFLWAPSINNNDTTLIDQYGNKTTLEEHLNSLNAPANDEESF